MKNLDMLKRQHGEMLTLIKIIETAAQTSPEDKAEEIAYSMNALSGKMKMHLLNEDQFLYPSLAKNEKDIIRTTAQQFNQEMGGLAAEFTLFVQKYNIPSKIIAGKSVLAAESRIIFQMIKERIAREDDKLYPLVEDNA